MQGSNNSRLLRLSNLKVRQQLNHIARGISMHICAPILKQYKSIDLSKSHNTRRIRHKTTYQTSTHDQNDIEKLISGKNVENIIDQYIEAKQKIVTKKGQMNNFQFLKLNKTHTNLYKRLVKRQSLPEAYLKKTQAQSFAQDNVQNSLNKTTKNPKIKEIGHTHYKSMHQPSLYHETSLNDHLINHSQKQCEDKFINNFLSNYFKKKYRHQSGRKEIKKEYKIQYKMLTKSRKKFHNNLMIKDQLYRTNTN